MARARWNRIGSSALIALLCGALAAFGLSMSSGSADPGSAPDVRSDDEGLSWSPVGDAQSYILVAEVEGKTVRQDVVPCCSVSLRDFADADAWFFLRANVIGSAWSRPHRPRVRPPVGGGTSGPPITPAPITPAPVGSVAPPGRVCDNQAARYPSPVAGAVVVDPAVDGDLSAKTDANPPRNDVLAPSRHAHPRHRRVRTS